MTLPHQVSVRFHRRKMGNDRDVDFVGPYMLLGHIVRYANEHGDTPRFSRHLLSRHERGREYGRVDTFLL